MCKKGNSTYAVLYEYPFDVMNNPRATQAQETEVRVPTYIFYKLLPVAQYNSYLCFILYLSEVPEQNTKLLASGAVLQAILFPTTSPDEGLDFIILLGYIGRRHRPYTNNPYIHIL